MEIKITKRTKLLEINNDMCHNFYYLVNGRFYNENKTAYRRFKFVIWFDIFDVDEYFNYKLGRLEWRSLRFDTKVIDKENYQGNAVFNYTDRETPYTRIIEHKHFEFGTQPDTVITKEYPSNWQIGDEAYYPVNDDKNNSLFEKYKELAKKEENVIFGGRLGTYRYYDMDKIIDSALASISVNV